MTLIVILARAPQPGRCKTRLQPAVSARGAAQLQAALLQRTARTAQDSGLALEIHATPSLRHPTLLRLRRSGIRLHRQPAGHLGRRMQTVARRALRTHSRVIILGTDCPRLTTADIHWLAQPGEPALIPANDGGYVALGLSAPLPRLFQAVTWGSPHVLQQSLRNLRRTGRRPRLSPPLPDLDTPQDWHRHRRQGWLSNADIWRRC